MFVCICAWGYMYWDVFRTNCPPFPTIAANAYTYVNIYAYIHVNIYAQHRDALWSFSK